jgi:23S rRNA (adenine2030-N6)-methyltransferase
VHYRHSYHAGNFADVFKHVVLCGLVAALNRKEAPWLYVDTHAGAGIYDLSSGEAARTGEWRGGTGKLEGEAQGGGEMPEPLPTWLKIVQAVRANSTGLYPGSPLFVQALAREQDRLVLCEKVPEVAASLKRALGRDPRVAVHVRDGYESYALLNLPLKQGMKRGLMLVDPPFERPDEFAAVVELVERSLAQFPQCVYALWYPVKNRYEAGRFARRIARLAREDVLNLTFDSGAPARGQMRACGMLIVNPPYRFDAGIGPALQYLVRRLAQGASAGAGVEWLARGRQARAKKEGPC